MTILYTDEEKRWIDMNKWGWPIKDGCPDNIKKEIERKKRLLDKQQDWVDGKMD